MLKRSGDLFLGSECCVVMQIGMRMQIVVCISMIDFMPGNGEHETGMFATFQGRRWLFESGTAIERRRRSPSAKGMSGGRAREGVRPPLVRGGGGEVRSPS